MHNGGFTVKIGKRKNAEYDKKIISDSLPPEYGSNITTSCRDNIDWYFFDPEEKILPVVNFYNEDNDVLELFSGTVYNLKSIEENLIILKNAFLNFDSDKISASLRNISGIYCGFMYDYKNKRGIAFTDRTGVCKLFYHAGNDEIILSTSLYLIKELIKEKTRFSQFAFSSILYCNWTFNGETILENVNQILPSHFIKISDYVISGFDYALYPSRMEFSIKESVEAISSSHLNYWKRICEYPVENIAMLVSKGKDSRAILKHMIDSGISPYLLSFYRKDENLKPFITFLTDFEDDSFAVKSYAVKNNLKYDRIRIENKYLLDNINEIVNLNNGTPLHWEFLAAAEYVSEKYKYIVTGYNGHILAGRNEHRDFFSGKINNYKDYSSFKFNEAGYDNFYNELKNLLNEFGVIDLYDVHELEDKWLRQYESIKSEDLDIISLEGQIRTRGIGRETGTFYQGRKYAVQLYPYLDNEIINSYLSVPSKHLKWEKAHLKQFSDDKRFNSPGTSKIKISAGAEAKFISTFGLLRKIYKFRMRKRKEKRIDDAKSGLYTDALKEGLSGFSELPAGFINKLFEKKQNSFGFYRTAANLLTVLRIKKVFFNVNNKIDRNINFIKYEKRVSA